MIVVVVYETTHTETFIVNNVVTKVNTIDSAVSDSISRNKIPCIGIVKVGIVGEADGIVCAVGETVVFQLIGKVRTHFTNINLGVILTIGIHVRTLEEVDTYCRRNTGIGTGTGTVGEVTIVAIAKTTFHVATHKVIKSVTQVGINPLAEVGFTQLIGRTVDDFIGIESHIVDFIIGRESKCLSTDFHTDRLTLGLQMDVTHIIENPPNALVTFQNLVGEKTTGHNIMFGLKGSSNVRGVFSSPFCFQRTGAEFIIKIIIGVITFLPLILTIVISIEIRSQIRRLPIIDT